MDYISAVNIGNTFMKSKVVDGEVITMYDQMRIIVMNDSWAMQIIAMAVLVLGVIFWRTFYYLYNEHISVYAGAIAGPLSVAVLLRMGDNFFRARLRTYYGSYVISTMDQGLTLFITLNFFVLSLFYLCTLDKFLRHRDVDNGRQTNTCLEMLNCILALLGILPVHPYMATLINGIINIIISYCGVGIIAVILYMIVRLYQTRFDTDPFSVIARQKIKQFMVYLIAPGYLMCRPWWESTRRFIFFVSNNFNPFPEFDPHFLANPGKFVNDGYYDLAFSRVTIHFHMLFPFAFFLSILLAVTKYRRFAFGYCHNNRTFVEELKLQPCPAYPRQPNANADPNGPPPDYREELRSRIPPLDPDAPSLSTENILHPRTLPETFQVEYGVNYFGQPTVISYYEPNHPGSIYPNVQAEPAPPYGQHYAHIYPILPGTSDETMIPPGITTTRLPNVEDESNQFWQENDGRRRNLEHGARWVIREDARPYSVTPPRKY